MIKQLRKEIEENANSTQAEIFQGFFRTDKGEYGEGDVFLGLKVPVQRGIAKRYQDITLQEVQELLDNKIHEYRLIGLIILHHKYKKGSEKEREKIFNFYLKNTQNINNWDLVDLSAPNIIGDFLLNKKKKILYELANSENLWEKRIAIVSTATFIRNKEFKDTLAISRLLLKDKHHLIHRAIGWMLREVGKRDLEILEDFLKENYNNLPRTTLRYAIEKFDEEKRKKWLKGEM